MSFFFNPTKFTLNPKIFQNHLKLPKTPTPMPLNILAIFIKNNHICENEQKQISKEKARVAYYAI